jgi:phosphate transport system permease protein
MAPPMIDRPLVDPVTPSGLRGDPRRHRKERVVHAVFLSAGLISIIISALIVFSLVGRSIEFLQLVDLSKLWEIGWFPRRGLFDVKTIVVGTLLVSAIAMLVAAPIGLGAAIFLSEYASPRMRRTLKPSLEVLAGIPSVVMGFFALTVISPGLVQRFFASATIFNIAAAGVGVGVLVIPLVASVAEDAMHAVPGALREAAYGLGAKKMTASLRVVFPAAISGIVASLILGVSRAIGETMVVAIAAGGTGGSLFTLDVLGRGQTMTGAMVSLATGSDAVRGAGSAYPSLFFVGLLLFLMTFLLNVASDRFVRRVRRKY